MDDVLGTPITPGSTIVYAANGGRAEHLRKAIVLRIAPRLVVRSEHAARAVVLRDPRRTVVVRQEAGA